MHARLAGVATACLIAGSAVLLAQGPPSNTSTPAATGAISGVVKSGATGRPIAGAVAELRFGSQIAPGPLARIQRQLTDAQGRFVFRDLPPGPGYMVSATRAGFVKAEFGQSVMFGPTGTITLSEGQWFSQADILMWRPGAIMGRVSDERGDPVVETVVRVLARQYVAGQLKLLSGTAARTDDRGEYRIAGLLPGRYLVVVPSAQNTLPVDFVPDGFTRAPSPGMAAENLLMGFSQVNPRTDAGLDLDPAHRLIIGNHPAPPMQNGRPLAYPTTFHPGVTSPASATPIEIALSEERRGVDIVLQPVPAVRVSGRLEGSNEPVAGTPLRLMPAGLEELASGSESATTLAAADGRFVFLNVPAGSYTLDARRSTTQLTFQAGAPGASVPSAPGIRESSGSSGSLPSGPPGSGYSSRGSMTEDRYWTRTPVVVGAADLENVVVTLHRGVSVSGRMVYEGTARLVAVGPPTGGRAGASAPLALVPPAPPDRGPVIVAEPADANASLGAPRSSGAVSPDGQDTFTIENLRSGRYVLRSASGAARYAIKSIVIAGRDVTYRPIDTSDRRDLNDIVITFTDKVTTIVGAVRGDPAPAAVIAFPVERDQWTEYGFTPVRLKGVPAAGPAGYRLEGLPAGEYFLVAVDIAHVTAWQDPKFLERAAGAATRVTIGWGEMRTVDLALTRIR
jgi:hypothetical protein